MTVWPHPLLYNPHDIMSRIITKLHMLANNRNLAAIQLSEMPFHTNWRFSRTLWKWPIETATMVDKGEGEEAWCSNTNQNGTLNFQSSAMKSGDYSLDLVEVTVHPITTAKLSTTKMLRVQIRKNAEINRSQLHLVLKYKQWTSVSHLVWACSLVPRLFFEGGNWEYVLNLLCGVITMQCCEFSTL